MEPGFINPFVFLFSLGIFPTLDLSSEEVNTLSVEDLVMLRGELGAGEPMLAALRKFARVPGRHFSLDFAAQAITVCCEPVCTHRPPGFKIQAVPGRPA